MEYEIQYVNAANKIAQQILRDAIWYKDSCLWMSFTRHQADSNNLSEEYKSVDGTLYSGSSGIAYFLLDLYQHRPSEELRVTIEGALRHAVSVGNEVHPTVRLGLYSGWMGTIMTLLYGSRVLNSPWMEQVAEQWLDQLMEEPIDQFQLDVIVGYAGAIPSLIAVEQVISNERLKDYILQISSHLITLADKSKGLLQWETLPGLDHNLTGYAHGAAGFFHAFMELYGWTRDKRYLNIADCIAAYEDQFFDEEEQNWPDFRHKNEENTSKPYGFFCGWCHGAPGIGLSRLRAYEITGDQKYLYHVDAAINNMKKHTSLSSVGYSLCHGYTGNATLALDSYRIRGSEEDFVFCRKIGEEVASHILHKNIPLQNGVGSRHTIPDLMTGSAGLGHFLLRMRDESISSILLVRKSHFESVLSMTLGTL